jgi:hypothetical protein
MSLDSQILMAGNQSKGKHEVGPGSPPAGRPILHTKYPPQY